MKCLNFLFYRYAQLRYIGVVNWQRKQYIVIAALAFHVRDELFCVKPVLENRDFLKKGKDIYLTESIDNLLA